MKLSYCCLAVLASVPLCAGVRIKIDQVDLKTNETVQQELLLDNDRLRVNMPKTGNSVLFLTDGGRNRLVILDTTKNEYRELDQQAINQLSQQLQGAMAALQNLPPEQRARIEQMMRGRGLPGQPAPAAKTVYTAQGSGSVNGFNCTKYEGMQGSQKVAEVCASKPADLHFSASDFQVFEKMREFASSLTSGLANSPLANTRLSDITGPGFEGFPVQRIAYSGGQATNKTEVKSIDRASFSDADFSVGSAKKVDLPFGRGRQ